MWGYFSWKDLIIWGRRPLEMLEKAPTRMEPELSPWSSEMA